LNVLINHASPVICTSIPDIIRLPSQKLVSTWVAETRNSDTKLARETVHEGI